VNDALDRIQRGIDFIEAHLFERPSLAAIARHAGASPWHFHRVFTAITGETPAGYHWKRQVACACERLVATEQPLVDLALDCGFESQSTFTRAFTRHVGVARALPPRRHRVAGASLRAARPGDAPRAPLWRDTMTPRLVHRPAFHAIGSSGQFTPATTSRIPELWERFARGPMDTVPHRRGHHTFGICADADPSAAEPTFTYVAAVEVERIDDVPTGLSRSRCRPIATPSSRTRGTSRVSPTP
jgi:AraC family transcriptional regulator